MATCGSTCSSDGECCGSCNLTTGRCEGTCKIESRNGYCTIAGCTFASATTYSQFACPTGSTCNNIFFGGLCMKDCDLAMATDCRNNANDKYGDYECYAWNNLSVGGVPVAANPVCSFSIAPCDIFGSNFVLDCTSLGNQSNPTSMGCRSLATKQLLSNTRDPAGYCLDNTTSGP